MQILTLIEALMSFDVLRARQWVADAMRLPMSWSEVARPANLDAAQLAVAAGVVELLAEPLAQGRLVLHGSKLTKREVHPYCCWR